MILFGFLVFFVLSRSFSLIEQAKIVGGILLGLILIEPMFSPVVDRAVFYYKNFGEFSPFFTLALSDCSNISIWGFSYPTHFCAVGDSDFFKLLMNSGVVMFLSWLAVVVAPFTRFQRGLKPFEKGVLSLCGLQILSGIHYTALDNWGVNYVYLLASSVLFLPSETGELY